MKKLNSYTYSQTDLELDYLVGFKLRVFYNKKRTFSVYSTVTGEDCDEPVVSTPFTAGDMELLETQAAVIRGTLQLLS